MDLTFHDDAFAEARQAAIYYDEQSAGLGNAFLDELDAAIVRLQRHPYTWAFVEQPYRRVLLHRFPYAVIYRIDDDAVFVAAVAHCKRQPLYWWERLE